MSSPTALSEQISTWVTQDDLAALKGIAANEKRSVAWIVREWIREKIAADAADS